MAVGGSTLASSDAAADQTRSTVVERANGPRCRDPLVEVALSLIQGEHRERSAGAAHGASRQAYVALLVADSDAHSWDLPRQLHAVRGSVAPKNRPPLFTVVTRNSEQLLVVLCPTQANGSNEADRRLADQLLRRLRSSGRAPVVTAAVAPSHDRVASAVNEAHVVMRVVRALDYPPAAYRMDDVLIEIALARSTDVVGRLAQRIRPLVESDIPLLQTLNSFLNNGGDRNRTARRLHIHRNTLLYRLRRIHELTGLSPTVPKDVLVLRAAVISWSLGT